MFSTPVKNNIPSADAANQADAEGFFDGVPGAPKTQRSTHVNGVPQDSRACRALKF